MKAYFARGPFVQRDTKWNCYAELETQTTTKKWGKEDLVSQNYPYTVKIMTVKAGAKVSNHFHIDKAETFTLISGKLCIDITDLTTGKSATVQLEEPGESLTLSPYVPHSFYCPEGQEYDTLFLECSTKDNSSDNYRFCPSTGPKDNNSR